MKKKVLDESIELAENAMLKHRPEFYQDWNFEKNNELSLDIYKVTYKSNKKAWWKCENGHEWETIIANRTVQGSGCPECNNGKGRRVIQKGINDMWTTNPEQAKKLLNVNDGYEYTQSSGKRVDWKCTECRNIIKNKVINDVYNYGLYCPSCSDNVPFGEKFMYNLLKLYNIAFIYDSSLTWSGRLRYDFYLPEHNWIIEVHGMQHYREGAFGDYFEKTRTFEEEVANDSKKQDLAKRNGIDNYIVIDVRESTLPYIQNSIENSEISMLIKEIDFREIGIRSTGNFIKEVCDLWNSGKTVYEISKAVKIKRRTILRYLAKGNDIGWCDYSREEDANRRGLVPTTNKSHEVVQLDKAGNYIAEWESMTEASKSTNTSMNSISLACRGKIKTAGGFKWVMKVNYQSEYKERVK